VNGGYWGATKPSPGGAIDRGHPLAQRLVGLWLLNEGAGAARELRRGALGVATTALPAWGASPSGPALQFTGASSQAALYTLPVQTDGAFSIVVRSYTTNTASRQTIVGANNVANTPWLEFAASQGTGKLAMVIPGVFVDVTTAAVVSNNTWADIVYTRPAGGAFGSGLFYVNGAAVAVSAGGSYTPAAATSWLLGARATGNQYLTGGIAFCYLYERVLSPAEIQQLRAAPYAMFAPPVWRQYFIPASGTTFTDVATGHAGAHGQTSGTPARTSATTGHTGAEGLTSGTSTRSGALSGSSGAHGQTAATPARTATVTGSAGAHGQCVGVATHTATATGHTGATGLLSATTARTSTSTGHAGAEGQTATTAPAFTDTAQGHAGAHGQCVGVASHSAALVGSAGSQGLLAILPARVGGLAGHAGSQGLVVILPARSGALAGHSGAQGLAAGLPAHLGTLVGQAGARSVLGERPPTVPLGPVLPAGPTRAVLTGSGATATLSGTAPTAILGERQ
jgi:hypothetical protein